MYQKALSSDEALGSVYLAPIFEMGDIVGFRVAKFDEGSPFLAFGVKPDDVLTKVNDQAFTTLSGAQAILKQAPEFKLFSITLLRDGKEQTLKYKVVD